MIALSVARPDGLLHGNDGYVSVIQNSLGTYKYNVQLKDSSRTEERLEDGTIIGEYTIPGANGLPQTIKYTSGRDGFRITEGLPVAPVDNAVPDYTPEVKAARAQFLAIHEAAAAEAREKFVPIPKAAAPQAGEGFLVIPRAAAARAF